MYSPYEPYTPLGYRHPNKNIICDSLKFYQMTDKIKYNLSYKSVPRLPPGKRESIPKNKAEYIKNFTSVGIKKLPRWIVNIYHNEIDTEGKVVEKKQIFEQFFFERTGQTCKYNYVFYEQGKDTQGRALSPRACMLTSFRALRKEVKGKMKAAKAAGNDELAKFYDVKQSAIKVCMNSVYGASDTYIYALFENIGPSAITR
jgi:hypothetical protein